MNYICNHCGEELGNHQLCDRCAGKILRKIYMKNKKCNHEFIKYIDARDIYNYCKFCSLKQSEIEVKTKLTKSYR
jgi:hypothetical protein